ncbi:fasciclin domain-containing protein [Erythrobacter sp. Alg231-14]|uniref:fasciclin domain-containing protein n=1 Tax=Erythrobacter sp. Alg231-14 TaxID=1922225 RepID=UPI000D54ED1B
MNTLKLTLASALALAMVACSPESDAGDSMMADGSALAEAEAPGTIVEVASGDVSFSTLVAAVTAAGLGETLSGEGPFTVFAPTNDAFGKIDEAVLTELTTNDTETLGTILTYHVVEGAVDAETLTGAIAEAGDAGYTVTTVGGGTLTATIVEGAVILTDANGGTSTVIATDVAASNGLVHAIDTVLMP